MLHSIEFSGNSVWCVIETQCAMDTTGPDATDAADYVKMVFMTFLLSNGANHRIYWNIKSTPFPNWCGKTIDDENVYFSLFLRFIFFHNVVLTCKRWQKSQVEHISNHRIKYAMQRIKKIIWNGLFSDRRVRGPTLNMLWIVCLQSGTRWNAFQWIGNCIACMFILWRMFWLSHCKVKATANVYPASEHFKICVPVVKMLHGPFVEWVWGESGAEPATVWNEGISRFWRNHFNKICNNRARQEETFAWIQFILWP